MWHRLWHFLQYNNTVPVALFILMGGATMTFAASPEARDAIYSEQSTIVSIDNRYLLSVDIEQFDFTARIGEVTEDEENYYVSYSFDSIEVHDHVWQKIPIERTMKVSKRAIIGKDLGIYVERQLSEVVGGAKADLVIAQREEKRLGESLKIASVAYSGLVGRLFDPELKELAGYQPVVDEKRSEPEALPLIPIPAQVAEAVEKSASKAVTSAVVTSPEGITITINGPAEIELAMGESYIDQGATAVDLEGNNAFLNVEGTFIDVNVLGVNLVKYIATDGKGNRAEATRKVTVVRGAVSKEDIASPSSAAVAESTAVELADSTVPVITISGLNPVVLQKGATYIDPGATVSDPEWPNLGVQAEGAEIDTSVPGTYYVRYNAVDGGGNRAEEKVRIVNVVDPTPPVEEVVETRTEIPLEEISPAPVPDSLGTSSPAVL